MTPPRHWQDPVCAVVGALLLVSPWLAGYALVQPAVANAVVVGLMLFTTAVGASVIGRPWVEGAIVVLGAWLLAAPSALALADARAIGVSLVSGSATFALGLVALGQEWWRRRSP